MVMARRTGTSISPSFNQMRADIWAFRFVGTVGAHDITCHYKLTHGYR